MKVKLQPELEEKTMLADLVRAATPVLEEAIGYPAERVTANWEVRSQNGKTVLSLTLSDWSTQETRDFYPEDLQPPAKARDRFFRLWGELLQKALRRQVKKLEAIGAEEM